MIRAIAALCLILAGCATAPLDAPDIAGRWGVVSIDGATTIRGRSPSLTISADSDQVGGGVACNAFSATMTRGERMITFTAFEMTAMACRIPGVDIERYYAESSSFIEVLTSGPITARITSSDELVLRGAHRREVRFRRLP
jgi:heat shock protein HslJ